MKLSLPLLLCLLCDIAFCSLEPNERKQQAVSTRFDDCPLRISGSVEGVATAVTVVPEGQNYRIILMLKNNQSYTALCPAPTRGLTFELISEYDVTNRISIQFNKNDVSGLNNTASFRNALSRLFNLDCSTP